MSDEQKQRWGEFADDDPRVDSISDLVRTSVEEFIATDNSGGGQLNDEVVDEVLSSLDTLERDIGSLETEIKALRTENVREDTMEALVRDEVETILGNLELYAPELFESTSDAEGGE
ncbi:hypothetical protein [Haloplanus salinarum]|uniref:hypothetical protein n=1 Tax=Haloplanus salinarum TaxID=1912324 RepID=UPI00214BAD3D|nr:hypothetical protein [Haloplanus salinarum]